MTQRNFTDQDVINMYARGSFGTGVPSAREPVDSGMSDTDLERDTLARKAKLAELVNKSRTSVKARKTVLIGGPEDPLAIMSMFRNAAQFKEICGLYASTFTEKDSWTLSQEVFDETEIFTLEEVDEALGEVTTEKKIVAPQNYLGELVSAPNVTVLQDVDFAVQTRLHLGGLVKSTIPLYPLKDSYSAVCAYLKRVNEAKSLNFEFAPYDDVAISLTVAICSRHRIQVVNNLLEVTPLLGSIPCASAQWSSAVDSVAKLINGKEPIGKIPSTFDRVSVLPVVYVLVLRHGRVLNWSVHYQEMQLACKAQWANIQKGYHSATADIDYGNSIIASGFSPEDFDRMKNNFKNSAEFWKRRQFLKDYADNQFLGTTMPHIGASYWGSIQMLYTIGCALKETTNPLTGGMIPNAHVYIQGSALTRRLDLLHHVLGIRRATLYVDNAVPVHIGASMFGKTTVSELQHMSIAKFRALDVVDYSFFEVWESYEGIEVDQTIIKTDGKVKDNVNAVLTVARDHAAAPHFATKMTVLLLAHNTFSPNKIPGVLSYLDSLNYTFRIVRHPLPANDKFYWVLFPKRIVKPATSELHKLLFVMKEAPMFDSLRQLVVANGYMASAKSIYFEERYFLPAWLFTMQHKLKHKSVKAGLIVETSAEAMKFASTFLVDDTVKARIAQERTGSKDVAHPVAQPVQEFLGTYAQMPQAAPAEQEAEMSDFEIVGNPTSPPPPDVGTKEKEKEKGGNKKPKLDPKKPQTRSGKNK